MPAARTPGKTCQTWKPETDRTQVHHTLQTSALNTSLDNINRSWTNMAAPYPIKQSRSISPIRRPPSLDRPSVGWRVRFARGPLHKHTHTVYTTTEPEGGTAMRAGEPRAGVHLVHDHVLQLLVVHRPKESVGRLWLTSDACNQTSHAITTVHTGARKAWRRHLTSNSLCLRNESQRLPTLRCNSGPSCHQTRYHTWQHRHKRAFADTDMGPAKPCTHLRMPSITSALPASSSIIFPIVIREGKP